MTKIETYAGLRLDVREAEADDRALLDVFCRHVAAAGPSRRAADADDGRTTTFLAFGGDGGLVAIAMLTPGPDGDKADVRLFTDERATHHGVSWALLEHVLTCARGKGLKTVESIFSAADVRASRLERTMGFEEVGHPGPGGLTTLRWTLAAPLRA